MRERALSIGGCLADDDFANYVGGDLDEQAAARFESHIDLCTRCRGFAAELLKTLPDDGPSTVAGYTVLAPVGTGASGVVYAAHDHTLDRTVALKLLFSTADASGFEREARAMAKVAHAHVVTIHEVGVHEGRAFMVMSLIQGVNLRRWLAGAKRDWRAVVRLMRALGEGLAAVHDAGLVHRDVKPENILVDERDHPWLSDFGLATASIGTSAQTRALGTPAYMAPEQAAKDEVDARSDIYAFCLCFYEALFHVRPAAPAAMPRSLERAPRWLARLLLKGIAPARSDRPASLRVLLDEIDRRLSKKRSGIIFAIGALLLGFSLVAIWSQLHPRCGETRASAADLPLSEPGFALFAQRFRATSEARCEEHARDATDDSRYALEQYCLSGQLADVSAKAAALARNEPLRDRAMVLARIPNPADCSDTQTLLPPLPTDPELRRRINDIQRALAAARALDDGGNKAQARAQLLALRANDDLRIYTPLAAEAELLYGTAHLWDDPEQAAVVLQGAARLAEGARDDRARATAMLYRSFALTYLDRSDEVEALLLDTEAVMRRTAPPAELRALYALIRAKLAQRRRDAQSGVAFAAEALAIEQHRDGSSEASESVYTTVLCTMQALAAMPDGVRTCERAREVVTRLYGEDHPRLVVIDDSLGIALFAVGNYDAALVVHSRALARSTRIYGTDHPMRSTQLLSRAQDNAALGRRKAGLVDLDEALRVLTLAHGPASDTVDVLAEKIQIEQALKRNADAKRSCSAAQRQLIAGKLSERWVEKVRALCASGRAR